MTTNKNRVQAYVSDAVYSKVREYAQTNNCSISTAVEQLLGSLTGIVLSDLPSNSLSQVKNELTNEIFGQVEQYVDRRFKLTGESLSQLEGKLLEMATRFEQELAKVYEKLTVLEDEDERPTEPTEEDDRLTTDQDSLTNAELARRLGVNAATVSRWGTGKRQAPAALPWSFNTKTKRWNRKT